MRKERINEIYEELWNTSSYIDKREATEKAIAIAREEMKDIYQEIIKVTDFDLMDIYKKLFGNLELFFFG